MLVGAARFVLDLDRDRPAVRSRPSHGNRAVIGACLIVGHHGIRRRFGYDYANLVHLLFVEPRGARQSTYRKPDDPDVAGAGGNLYLNGRSGQLYSLAADAASSTESWIGNTLVSPVILKIFRILSCVQTSDRLPS